MKLSILACVFLFATLSVAFPSPNDWDSGSEDDAAKRESQCAPKPKLLDECHDTKSLPKEGDDESAIIWFQKCIVMYYCFIQGDKKKQAWTEQPNFAGKINTPHFNRAAEVAKKFFLGKTWKGPQGLVPTYMPKGSSLLYITAARYLYVTSLLFQASEDGIAPCAKVPKGDKEGKEYLIVVPEAVCFMEPIGSATSTSDYDASLVGKQSGQVIALFNELFKGIFGKPSEEVFDTNIYAFSLEYAMPYLYVGHSDDFKKKLREMEADDKYKIQDLVNALYKIRKYDFEGTEETKDKEGVEYTLLKNVFIQKFNAKNQKLFKSWDFVLNSWDKNIKNIKGLSNLRNEHNEIYSGLVKEHNEFTASYLTQVALADIYAAEAYHSRGTVRYIVGWTQLKNKEVRQRLTPLDFWTSMLENWGDTLKEHKHCKVKSEVCLVKMSKYMKRTLDSMVEIRAALAVTDLKDVSPVAKIAGDWVTVKKSGKPSIENAKEIGDFFQLFGCKDDKKGSEISRGCIDKMFALIKTYNYKLIEAMNDGKI